MLKKIKKHVKTLKKKLKLEKEVEELKDEVEELEEESSNKTMIIGILAAILLVLGGAFFLSSQSTIPTSNPQINLPVTTTAPGVALGDTVKVRYTGKLLNGTVFDTNVDSIAKANGLSTGRDLLSFKVGAGQMISGFDKAVIGMEVGDKKTVTLSPDEAYGESDPTKLQVVPISETMVRTNSIKKSLTIPVDLFSQVFGEKPVAEKEFSSAQSPFSYKVIAFDDSNVSLSTVAEVGQILSSKQVPWNSTVISFNDTHITIREDPQEGQVIDSALGPATVSVTNDSYTVTYSPKLDQDVFTGSSMGKVVGITDSEITIDFNSKLAGKTLVFDIEMVEINKPQKVEAASFDLFVMSFCPYGQQAEKSVKPVVELLGKGINFEPHYVIYEPAVYNNDSTHCEDGACSMHGIGELHEDARQLCIWKNQEDKWWDYVTCVNSQLTPSNVDEGWKQCAATNFIDIPTIEQCYAEEGNSLLLQEMNLAKAAGATGSPTFIVNKETYSGDRSSEGIKTALCSSMNSAPEECSQAISSTTSAATGSC